MQYKEFITSFMSYNGISTESEAVNSVRSVLTTLAERLQGGAANHVASQLPDELKVFMSGNPESIRYTYQEFLQKVAERENSDIRDASEHIKGVFSLIYQSISPGEFKHLMDQLPSEYKPLFDSIENK